MLSPSHPVAITVSAPPGVLTHGPIMRLCLAAQVLIGLTLAPLYARAGLEIDWISAVPYLVVVHVLYAVAVFLLVSGDRNGHAALAMALIVSLALIISPAQYLAVALRRPLIDPWLSAADTALGIRVGDLATQLRAWPSTLALLSLAYFTLLPQFILVPLCVAGARRTGRLWTYVAQFHVCAIVTVAALALFPAACAFQYQGFASTLEQSRFIQHFNGVRAGTFHRIDFRELDGLISVPSFHVAGVLMTTWAVRGFWLVRWLIAVNVLVIAAAVMSGAHYLIDVPITVGLFVFSVWFVKWYRRATA